MAYYIAALAHALVPAILIIGLWHAAAGADRRYRTGMGVSAGAVAGLFAILTAALSTSETSIGVALHVAAFVAEIAALVLLLFCAFVTGRKALPKIGAALFRLRSGFGPVLAAILIAQGLFGAWSGIADHGLSATDVVNTDLIVNCFAILIGIALLAILAVVLGRVARAAGGIYTTTALALVLTLALVTESGQLVLGLLRLELTDVTAGRISYVASLSLADPWLVYADLALCLALAVIAYGRRFRMAPLLSRVEQRLQLARTLSERRWRNGLAAIAALLLALLAYQDLYASLPPALSPAEPVEADDSGHVRIPVDQVKDSKLHRFAYITEAGHRVRFFLLNRYDEAHVDIGVVYDACTICGDTGYLQRGDEIICLACNVRLFRPSIGKPGGCNPIPLPHTVRNGVIVIAASALEGGAHLFPEVVDIPVTDPVTGQALTNRIAPFQHEFEGHTYFFDSKDSYEKFRAAPQSYGRSRAPRAGGAEE